ncbi:MAG: cysteine synthase family protein [Planctomycetota bacterium]
MVSGTGSALIPGAPTGRPTRAPLQGLATPTPLVELTALDTGRCRLFAKLELQNPTGSIKDRVATAMIRAAEAEGRLRPGMTIVEGSSGNATIALGAVARRRGYKVLAYLPASITEEKLRLHRALGVGYERFSPDPAQPFRNVRRDEALARAANDPKTFCCLDQFSNAANVRAHEATTGREIVEQSPTTIDRYFAGAGTGGSLVGIGRALLAKNPATRVTLVDPEGSTLAAHFRRDDPSRRQQAASDGIGERFVPGNLEMDLVHDAVTVSRERALRHCVDLARATGIVAGPCTGYSLAAALDWCQTQPQPRAALILVCDRGENYFSDPDYAAAFGL